MSADSGNRAAVALQPWRALNLGFCLLMTKTRPLRRTVRHFAWRFFIERRELTIFMGPAPQAEGSRPSVHVAAKLADFRPARQSNHVSDRKDGRP